MKRLILAFLLAGCAAEPLPLPPPPPALRIPDRLQSCPSALPAPVLPPSTRTVQQLASWGVAEHEARIRAERSLRVCADRLDDLNVLIHSRLH